MRPRKEHLPCGISKIHLKRAYPEGQEDEGLLVESPESLRGPSSWTLQRGGSRGWGTGQGGETGDLAFHMPLSCPPPPRKQGRCSLLKSLPPTQEFWDLTQSAGCRLLKTNQKKNVSPQKLALQWIDAKVSLTILLPFFLGSSIWILKLNCLVLIFSPMRSWKRTWISTPQFPDV